MRHRWMVCLLLLALVPAFAQQSTQPQPGVIRINVNLIQVDAVVTDSKGKPVTDLKAEDFEVFQDGKAQRIRNFEFVRVAAPLPVARPRNAGGPPPPSTVLRPDQVRRTIALVVDDLALSFDGITRTREALKKWVDNDMQPGDLISIVRTNAASGALQQFTNDKRLLYAAIDRLKFQVGRVSVQGFGGTLSDGIPGLSVFDEELAHRYLVGSLGAIQYVVRGLRDVPGRKSLILFSEDMRLEFVDGPGLRVARVSRQTNEERFRRLVDDANRSSVVIYAIDPRGAVNPGFSASDNLGGLEADTMPFLLNTRMDRLESSRDGMIILSGKTGGLLYTSNDSSGALRRAVDDGDGYYLMGYQPETSTFNANSEGPRYHTITMRVKRPGLKVRSRSGFFGTPDGSPALDGPETRTTQMAKALVSPFTTGALRVRLTALFSNSDAEGSFFKTMLHFDARDLTFTEEPDGNRSATVDIAIVTFNEDGDVNASVDKTWKVVVAKENYEEVLRKGLVYSTPVAIDVPGPYQLRVALRDAASQKLGSAMQFVEVPDLNKRRLTLSGIVVTADPPVPADPEGTPAVRIFKSGGAISYAYEILNAKPQLEMQTRLFREGEMVHETTPSPLNPSAADRDSKRLIVGGRMQLTKIPPGAYVLQIIVSDSLGKDKSQIAAQAIDFEVRP